MRPLTSSKTSTAVPFSSVLIGFVLVAVSYSSILRPITPACGSGVAVGDGGGLLSRQGRQFGDRLLDVRDLGARAVDVIRENYSMSIAVNAAGLIIGAGGALSPVLAAILHNASSVAVVANSSRLIRYRLD